MGFNFGICVVFYFWLGMWLLFELVFVLVFCCLGGVTFHLVSVSYGLLFGTM